VGLDGRAAGVAFLLGALALMTLAAYGGAGKRTVRRQTAVLALAAAALLVVVLAAPLLLRSFGWGLIAALMAVNVLTVFAIGRQIADARPSSDLPAQATTRKPARPLAQVPAHEPARPTTVTIVMVSWAVLLALGAVIAIALRATRW
jgi:hypothetical protein